MDLVLGSTDVYELTRANKIWNRACGENPGKGAGDRALHAVIQVHGVAMNGGVRHCFDVFARERIDAAIGGYRYFGLTEVSNLFQKAASLADDEAEEAEEKLNQEYYRYVPDDGELIRRFESHFGMHSEEYEPLEG